MKTKVFIDGSEGTTGLRIHERFSVRDDIELLTIDPELRKDADERKKLINASDITFLCLPDAAAKEAVAMVENDHVRIIDTSTHIVLVQALPMVSLNYHLCTAKQFRLVTVLPFQDAMQVDLYLLYFL